MCHRAADAGGWPPDSSRPGPSARFPGWAIHKGPVVAHAWMATDNSHSAERAWSPTEPRPATRPQTVPTLLLPETVLCRLPVQCFNPKNIIPFGASAPSRVTTAGPCDPPWRMLTPSGPPWLWAL